MEISKQMTVCIKIVILLIFMISCNQSVVNNNNGNGYLDFPEELSPQTPFDVDVNLEKRLLSEHKLSEVQRMFEILSWQMFISLNWPVDNKGNYLSKITDAGDRIWESWKESFEVFREDGSIPHAWGSKTDLPEELQRNFKVIGHEDVLFRTSKFSVFKGRKWKRNKDGGRNLTDQADEVNQAFTAPIWDQNGNIVHYEIRLNKSIVDYIVQNELYNIDGQIVFSKAKKIVSFPVSDRKNAGSIELKFAWKIIEPEKDFPERYFTKTAYVLEKDGSFAKKTVGLIGMHIGTKTVSSPQWIWATFEQVDNLETNDLEKIDGKALKPSFYDPECPTCAVDLIPDTTQKIIKSQIQRVLPISMATQSLNKRVQSILKARNSYWQYYQLIGTQWPTDPSSKPYPLKAATYNLPEAVTNKSGGKPVPTYLTNMVMETYFQGGTIVGNGKIQSVYNKFLGNEPAFFQIEGSPQNIDTIHTHKMIFGTEGCIGCHSSSSIAIRDTLINFQRMAIYGPPRTADFEWLLQLKAQFKTDTSLVPARN
jgi:hypothetical protein